MKVSFIGSGNVATHLAYAFHGLNYSIAQVYSPKLQNAQLLAQEVQAQAITDIAELDVADIYFIAVKDSAIATVAAQLADLNIQGIVVHTSGSTDINALATASPYYGVFYPLQTFSKNQPLDFKNIPLLLEANDQSTLQQLDQLARGLSQQVYHYSSAQRRSLHLAAVLACNFSNYLYSLADQYLNEQGVDFNLLKPLILETAHKSQNNAPVHVQTGPAVRHDQTILDMHMQMLNDQPQLQQIYQLLSSGIMQLHS
ncbi:Rossmann-like and DUF2520 domain-containing protein [Alkanindiges sp. WGS2144]|uniref:Rossmann-like and DUF2520 domain-containing protein n=1 Tax=Alkanindiges sp. WGS2144 TaxID=3366808 RepID=UPI003751B684